MSKIRLSPAYLGYIQSPNNDKKVLTRKRYFLQDITKPRKYKNKDVIYAKQENPEECWIKFMFGSEKYHHTMNIDLDRVSRSHWMFSILDYLAKIDSSNYDTAISFQSQSKNREKISVSLPGEIYSIIIEHDQRTDKMVVITAFTKKTKG